MSATEKRSLWTPTTVRLTPSTATEPFSSAPKCAAASIPRVSPETTTIPDSPSSAASSRARRRPLAEALRAPTTATIGARIISGRPSMVSTGGASSTAASAAG